MLGGQRYDIRAGVHTISGYSVHSGQTDLINFVRRMRYPPREVRLVHGDMAEKQTLKSRLEALALGMEILIPGNANN